MPPEAARQDAVFSASEWRAGSARSTQAPSGAI